VYPRLGERAEDSRSVAELPEGTRAISREVSPSEIRPIFHDVRGKPVPKWRRPQGSSLMSSINNDIMPNKGKRVEAILQRMRRRPTNARYTDLARVCDAYFGRPRQQGSSHRVYKTPWAGDPRVNVQNDQGKAKAYQVRQVLKAIDRLEKERGS